MFRLLHGAVTELWYIFTCRQKIFCVVVTGITVLKKVKFSSLIETYQPRQV